MADSFEEAMAASERAVDAAVRTATATLRELRRARASAKAGQIRELRRALAAAESAATAVAEETRAARAGFDLDDQEYLASGGYAKELLEAASSAGVAMFEEDERLLCYPSLVRIVPDAAAVEIDKARERRLRPSVLVGMLRARQERPPKFKPEAFLDSLRTAYELVVARDGKRPDAVVRLIDIWAALTMLPNHGREYGKQEFARDLYLLDQSGVTTTGRSTRRLRWSASTGTKGSGVLTTVARTGQQQRYWGVAFTMDNAEARP
jgi:hypothetical protein